MSVSKEQAFILRIKPSWIDRVPEALDRNEIIIGWADAAGLLNRNLSWGDFREIIFKEYYSDDKNYRRAGSAAGNIWRFIREMNADDFVIVPYYNSTFYIAQITCENAFYLDEKREEDSAYRRSVKWLNDKEPYERSKAYSRMQSRMKTQSTCVSASDLLPEIQNFIVNQKKGIEPNFIADVMDSLKKRDIESHPNGRDE